MPRELVVASLGMVIKNYLKSLPGLEDKDVLQLNGALENSNSSYMFAFPLMDDHAHGKVE